MYLIKIKWTLLWSLFILVLCFLPGKSFPSTNWLEIFQFDKWIHAFLFMMLYLVTVFEKTYLQLKNKRVLYASWFDWKVVVYCLLLAAGTELIQHFFLKDRSGDYLDFIANSFGIVVALFLWKILKKQLFRQQNEGTV